jgi:hypothetical protein
MLSNMTNSPLKSIARDLLEFAKSVGLSGPQAVIIFNSLVFALLLFSMRDWERLSYFQRLWGAISLVITGGAVILGFIMLILN